MPKIKRSKAEQEQLLQTVQMFEVIAETQPNDVQSLEILKEAYLNLERDAEAVTISKKIAQAYLNTGQLSSAILEYEGILQKFPDDAASLAALGELEGKMNNVGSMAKAPSDSTAEMTSPASESKPGAAKTFEDGNERMLRFLLENGILNEKDAKSLSSTIASLISQTSPKKPGPAMMDLLSERGISSVEKTLGIVAEKTRIPYIPLSIYEIDTSKAGLLDQEYCLKNLVLPFDQISKTVLIATSNPFNGQVKAHAESQIEGRIQWYITEPQSLVKQLKYAFHIQS
jgi:tetratricopeptide (TPR) repeat protein